MEFYIDHVALPSKLTNLTENIVLTFWDLCRAAKPCITNVLCGADNGRLIFDNRKKKKWKIPNSNEISCEF